MMFQRRSPRLQGYDYTQEGAYFVTVCTFERYELFGEIAAETMVLNSLGEIAHSRWLEIPQHFPNVELDLFVVMPNHVHGIVLIVDQLSEGDESMKQPRTRHASSLHKPVVSSHRPIGANAGSVGAVLGSYKAAVTRDINKLLEVRAPRVWQTRYHDHIIRSEPELQQIQAYIAANPARWEEDKFFVRPKPNPG